MRRANPRGQWVRFLGLAPRAFKLAAVPLPIRELELELGSALDFGFKVGGGGGHELHVKKALLRLRLHASSHGLDSAAASYEEAQIGAWESRTALSIVDALITPSFSAATARSRAVPAKPTYSGWMRKKQQSFPYMLQTK